MSKVKARRRVNRGYATPSLGSVKKCIACNAALSKNNARSSGWMSFTADSRHGRLGKIDICPDHFPKGTRPVTRKDFANIIIQGLFALREEETDDSRSE